MYTFSNLWPKTATLRFIIRTMIEIVLCSAVVPLLSYACRSLWVLWYRLTSLESTARACLNKNLNTFVRMELKFEKFHDDQFNSFLFDFRRKKNRNKQEKHAIEHVPGWVVLFRFCSATACVIVEFFLRDPIFISIWHSTCAFACRLFAECNKKTQIKKNLFFS